MNILVVRFRQMGDAILATSLLNTLHNNFPEATIDFVLNKKIAPLFEGHPSISNIITFTDEERHSTLTYIKKVWRTVHAKHYDMIIDMRSTVNTMLFALLSPSTRYRIGLRKGYTRLAFNHFVDECRGNCSMAEYDASLAAPLNGIKPIQLTSEFTLHITDEERNSFGEYLQKKGINLTKPILLANVTAKLAHKVWNEDYMIEVLDRFIKRYGDWQIIFNYAPGQEEENARRIYERLGKPANIFIDVQARSSRELVAMGTYMTLFFGNEGGARHIMHAAGCPSLVICAPENSKVVWIPQTAVKAEGIAPSDYADETMLSAMSRDEKYALITPDIVWERLTKFINEMAF